MKKEDIIELLKMINDVRYFRYHKDPIANVEEVSICTPSECTAFLVIDNKLLVPIHPVSYVYITPKIAHRKIAEVLNLQVADRKKYAVEAINSILKML